MRHSAVFECIYFTGIHAVVESAKVCVSPFDISSGIVQSYFCRLTVSHSVTLRLCSLFSQETRINCIRIARKGELFNADATELFLEVLCSFVLNSANFLKDSVR